MSRLRVYARIARVLLVVTLGLSMASVFSGFSNVWGWPIRWSVGSAGRGFSWRA